MTHHLFPALSPDALKALRDTHFTGGEIDGFRFIRCGSRLAAGEANHLAAHICDVTGLTSQQVCAAHNPDYAEHDYLRIAVDTPLYALICGMKS